MVTPPMHQTNRRYIKGSDGNPIFTYASYGGFTFPAAINLKMNVEPVYDSSGRIPKWWKHTFTIETVIDPTLTPESDSGSAYPVDLNMSQVRRWLSIPGQPLTFWNLGIGQNQRLDFSSKSPTGLSGTGTVPEPVPFSNPSTGTPIKQDPVITTAEVVTLDPRSNHYSFYVDNLSDLNFGPKPQLLSCECIGGSRAYRIVWTVECALPNCCVEYTGTGFKLCDSPSHFNDGSYRIDNSNPLLSNLKVTEFNYSLSWAIDEDRFTTFSIVGSLEVAGTLFHSSIDTTSEAAKSNFTSAVMDSGEAVQALGNTFLLRPGFNRSMQYDISRDKRRLDFRITDKEIPSDNAYYPGIKSCSLKHSVSGNPYRAKWNITFDGDFEVQPGVAKYVGLLAFVAVISKRMADLRLGTSEAREKDGSTKQFKTFFLPKTFSFQDDVFSRKVSLSFNFEAFFLFDKLLELTKLFTNTDETWLNHRNNLSPYILDHRGTARIITLSHEPLVTVCRNPDVFYDVTQTWFKPQTGQQYNLLESECPDKEKAILDIQYTIKLESQTSVVPQRFSAYVSSGFNQSSLPPSAANNPEKIALPGANQQVSDKIASLPNLQGQINSQSNSSDPKAYNIQMQSLGASKNYLILRAAIKTLCHDIRSLDIRTVKVVEGTQTKDIPPIVISQNIERQQSDVRSKVPELLFLIEQVYLIEKGTPLGSLNLFINGVQALDTPLNIVSDNASGSSGGGGSTKLWTN